MDQATKEQLKARFNPEGSPLRRQQYRMLEMITEVDRICRKHHIPYWLSGGTLLGAIRHDGFLPWDDDLDIEMLRPDYYRLLQILPSELPETMALQSNETDPNYFYCYAKVRDRRSRLLEKNHYDRIFQEQGIFIDIFPIEKQFLWVHRLSEKTIGHMYKVWRLSQDDNRSIRQVLRIFHFNRKVIFPCMRAFCKLFGAKDYSYEYGIPSHLKRYSRDLFPLQEHDFEGHKLLVPHDYDHYLRSIFGDYMQLPDLNNLIYHVDTLEFYD